MKTIDRIFDLLEEYGQMSTPEIAEKLGIGPKAARAVIRDFVAAPDDRMIYQVGKSPTKKGKQIAIWGLTPPMENGIAVNHVPIIMRAQDEPTSHAEDRYIAATLPLLRSMADNHWRTCIVQLAV